jgi:hypothetical protein
VTAPLKDLVIRFPARPGYLSISRLNVTAMAATAGFDVEGLDDLRLAIDEAVTWLVGDGGGDEPLDPTAGADGPEDAVELTISCRPGVVECRGHRTVSDDVGVQLDDLVGAILGATVDEVDVGIDPSGRRYIELVKRLTVDG